MKRTFITTALVLVSAAALADVKLVVRPDGSKVIVSSGSGSPGGVSETTLRWLARQRNRVSVYDEIIERYALEYGVDPVLVRAVIQVESNFQPTTVSHKGARGLMQLMPGTAKRFGVTDIDDPVQNIRGGIHYLSVLLDLHPNDLPRVLASYNAGENAVARYRGIPPYRETRQYVQKALTVYYGQPWGASVAIQAASKGSGTLRGGFTQPAPKLPPTYAGAVVAVAARSGARAQ